MLACVEAEAALDQALMAADLALARLKKENSPVDFSVEITELETAIARAETLFDNGEVIEKFFSGTHVKDVKLVLARARRRLRDMENGDTRRQSVLEEQDIFKDLHL